MRAVILLLGLTILLPVCTGCKRDEKSPCQRLVEKEAECGYEKGVSLGDCEKNIRTVRMRTAVDCLKAKDCHQFLACRKESDELKGFKTGLESL